MSDIIRVHTEKLEGVTLSLLIIIISGAICMTASLLMPISYGKKLNNVCEREPAEWKASKNKK